MYAATFYATRFEHKLFACARHQNSNSQNFIEMKQRSNNNLLLLRSLREIQSSYVEIVSFWVPCLIV